MTCDVLRIFRADTLMRSTTMEKHDNVFIVRITGPIISRESQAIAGDHLYFLRRGICPLTDIDGGLTWRMESFARSEERREGKKCVRTCRARVRPNTLKKKKKTN